MTCTLNSFWFHFDIWNSLILSFIAEFERLHHIVNFTCCYLTVMYFIMVILSVKCMLMISWINCRMRICLFCEMFKIINKFILIIFKLTAEIYSKTKHSLKLFNKIKWWAYHIMKSNLISSNSLSYSYN